MEALADFNRESGAAELLDLYPNNVLALARVVAVSGETRIFINPGDNLTCEMFQTLHRPVELRTVSVLRSHAPLTSIMSDLVYLALGSSHCRRAGAKRVAPNA